MTKEKEVSAQPIPISDNAKPSNSPRAKSRLTSGGAVKPKSKSRGGTSKASKKKADVTVTPFNPLSKEALGGAIAQVLLTTKVYPLNKSMPFKGAGIYALYYTGDFPEYAEISNQNKGGNFEAPIYVGQALPKGGRTGLKVNVESAALRGRLSKHRLSIKKARNLKIKDFHYRALVLDDTFIRLGESSLIALFAPIWNSYVSGFGNNPLGANRGSVKSRWDSLHPGRTKKGLSRDETRAQIKSEIEAILRAKGPNSDRTLISAEGQSEAAGLSSADLERVVNADAGESEQLIDEKDDAQDAE
jgi:hypothetical protein